MTRFLAALGIFAVAAAATTQGQPLTPGQKTSELQQIADMVRSSYGPYRLKHDTLKVDVDEMLPRYLKKADGLANLQFYYLLNQFVAEFQDSHFTSRVKSRHVSYLGFLTDRIQGKVLIDEIDRTLLPKEVFPFTFGDEIVSVDGRPAADVVAELGSYIGSGYKQTELRSAAMFLAYRPSTTVPPMYGKVKLKIHSAQTNTDQEVTLPWRQKGGVVEEGTGWGGGAVRKDDYMNLAVDDYFDSFPRAEKNFLCSPKSRIDPPKDATILMATPFVAYYYPTPKGNIGYLRIPHYSWPSNAEKTRLEQYEWAVFQLEQKTVGLVIDQDHNCGGKVNFLEDLVKLFADKPFKGVQFQFLASRNEYFTFKSFAEEEEENTLGEVAMNRIVDAVKKAWQAGTPMTEKITYHGDQLLYPNGVHYTKPIIVLADEMSGSGGDAFPALMQGMGRAKILGTRTMGAGGHVVEAGPLSYSGNKVRLTKSLFFHPNGKPIENNGVTPDYPYTPTVHDFLNGYDCYRKFYTQRILDLVDPAGAAARASASLATSAVVGAAAAAAADVACP